ncbi:MAG: phenylalanine--tRNA ligase subunit beta [Pyrinomonadaceae bacterium]
MNISYNWLRELTGVEWDAAELRERLTMRGLEVEGVADAGDDYVFEIAVLSNRPDWLSHLGIAREVGVMTGRGVVLPEMTAQRVAGRAADFTSVEVEAADLCPRFTARVVRGVRIAPSPAWLVERLEAVGLRSVNNVADITNFVMLELGQPLHAFDLDKLTEQRIVVRRARAGERLRTLDDVERKLDAEMLVIADAARAVAVAGVMGGAETEISDATVNVLVECAYFDPASVRRTSRQLGLQTDASDRFERRVDYDGLLRAQARTVALITEIAGGAATEDAIDVYPQPFKPPTVALRFPRVNALTALDVAPREATRILNALGFASATDGASNALSSLLGENVQEMAGNGAVSSGSESAAFVVPTWRADVTAEEDLVEEVARHFGYEKIEGALPASDTVGEYRAHEGRRRAARRALADSGFDEAISFSFIDAAHDGRFELIPDLASESADAGGEADERFVSLSNPIIEGAARMRATLLPGLLAAVRHNFNHGTRDVRLFETGRVFAAAVETGACPVERESFALVATGGATEADRVAAPRELDFYDVKGALEAAADAMKLAPLTFDADDARHLREGQSARVSLGGRAVGFVGRLTDEIGAAYKFRQPLYVAEVSLSALLDAPETPARYAPLARFPGVARDASVVVERRTTFAEMRSCVLDMNLDNVRGVELVYTYEGERVPEGKRSVTLRVEYRADDRTLRDEEADALHKQIVDALEKRFGAGLR